MTGPTLMTALHPATRASEPDADGKRHSEHNPGSLGKDPVDCAPCEAPDGHPLLKDLQRFHVRGPAEKLFEEAYDWARPLTDDECLRRNLVGVDVNVDLSRVKVGKEWVEPDGSMLPSPFTPKGERPEGPAWYATPTLPSSSPRPADDTSHSPGTGHGPT